MVRQKSNSKQDPQIQEMSLQTMAVVYTRGDPNVVGALAMPALYGAVYSLKFALKKKGIDLKIGALRARWPNAAQDLKDQWVGIWGLPLPDGTAEIPQKVSGVDVKIERWEYGTVAQILHVGLYSEEPATIQRLHDFIAENGYAIAGTHEEEYLTTPKAKVQKTLIRYPIRKK